MAARKWIVAAMLRPVIDVWGWIESFHAEASAAKGAPHGGDALQVALGRVAHAELQRAVALGDQRACLVHELRGVLVTERDAARVGGDRSRGAAEQTIERPARGLGADVPER